MSDINDSLNRPQMPATLPRVDMGLDPRPPLVRGRCNWCGAKTKRPSHKCCSPECVTAWRNLMMRIGPMVAEREIVRRIDRRKSPQPARASRARPEIERICDTYLDELRTAQKVAGGCDG